MEYGKLLNLIFDVAVMQSQKGPGWAQQASVLGEVANRIGIARNDDRMQQRILTCWHDLFRLGRLSWGYNIDNPDAPFFHVPEKDPSRDGWER
jgi:hypothetical protein